MLTTTAQAVTLSVSLGQSRATIYQRIKVWIIIFILCPSDVQIDSYFKHPIQQVGCTSFVFVWSDHWNKLYISAVQHVSAEQTAVFREGQELFHTIRDISCILKPLKTKQKVNTGNIVIKLTHLVFLFSIDILLSMFRRKLTWYNTARNVFTTLKCCACWYMQPGAEWHRKQFHYKPPELISCCVKCVVVTAVIEVYESKKNDPFLSSGFFFPHRWETELTDKLNDTLKIFMMTFVTFL